VVQSDRLGVAAPPRRWPEGGLRRFEPAKLLWLGVVAALAGKSLVRLVLKDDRVIAEQRLLTELNARIRGVADGPDGALYVLTDGTAGKILRLVPKK